MSSKSAGNYLRPCLCSYTMYLYNMAACVNPIQCEKGLNETLNPREAKITGGPCWILAIKNCLTDGTWKTNLLYVEEKNKKE